MFCLISGLKLTLSDLTSFLPDSLPGLKIKSYSCLQINQFHQNKLASLYDRRYSPKTNILPQGFIERTMSVFDKKSIKKFIHSAERCISPPFFRNMQPHHHPLDTHHGKIPDSMMIHRNQGDCKKLIQNHESLLPIETVCLKY